GGHQRGRVVHHLCAGAGGRGHGGEISEHHRTHAGKYDNGVSRQVRDGEADIGITTFWSAEDDLETEMLLRDAFGVVVPSGHAIAQASGKLTWRALKGV